MASADRIGYQSSPQYGYNSHTKAPDAQYHPSSYNGAATEMRNGHHQQAPNGASQDQTYYSPPPMATGYAAVHPSSNSVPPPPDRFVPTPMSSCLVSPVSTPSISYQPSQYAPLSAPPWPQQPVSPITEYAYPAIQSQFPPPSQHSPLSPMPQHVRPEYGSSPAPPSLAQNWYSQSSTWPQAPVSPIPENVRPSHGASVGLMNAVPPLSHFNVTQPMSHRPAMPHHQFTQPYIATPYEHPQQAPTLATAQFEHPYQPQPTSSSNGLFSPPFVPARPLSAPPGTHQDWKTDIPGQPVIEEPVVPSFVPCVLETGATTEKIDDQKKSHGVSRFVGNMLVVRVGRAGVQTLQSTAKLPFYLSPWGDNNPVTLPNIRKRDVALAGFAHVGVDALAPSAVTLVEHAVQYAGTFAAEKAADSGLNRIAGSQPPAKVKRRIGIDSLTLRIKHKLIDEEAELLFREERESTDKGSCAKGWFCPFLYASGRTPDLARSKDFSLAQLVRPGLAADASIAPTLLSTFAETLTPIISLCPWEPSHPTFPRYQRMAIFLVGISPYRTESAWSQSRIPNEARLSFHVFTHIPALVVPVSQSTPVLAWSPWTVEQMLSSTRGNDLWQLRDDPSPAPQKLDYNTHLAYGYAHPVPNDANKNKAQTSGYDASNHCREIKDFLDTVVDGNLMDPGTRQQWRSHAGNGVANIIDGVLTSSEAVKAMTAGVCDLERAGIVMFRY